MKLVKKKVFEIMEEIVEIDYKSIKDCGNKN